MLRNIRLTLAIVCLVLITLLFLDFTGTVHIWFGWLAQVQFLPAVLALNIGVIAVLVLITLLLGRVYCSVICPLGVMQDVFAWFGKRARKNRYAWSPAKTVLRCTVLVVMLTAIVAGIGSVMAFLAPYSTFGRIAQNILAPVYGWGNNLLAGIAEHVDSYAFYSVDVWVRSAVTFGITVATFIIIIIMAWRNGRTWCNTICPVGTVLGFLSRFSLFKVAIDTKKCNGCGLCARNCKAACIDSKEHRIDYSRCVTCMDCIGKCRKGAISYVCNGRRESEPSEMTDKQTGITDRGRRMFLTATAVVTTSSFLKAQEKKVDGGLAVIEEKKIPKRQTPIVPPGAHSLRNMALHCTACQLCVSVCPNGVLRPSTRLETLMQPESSYERGYCRPECTKCSEVCSTGAILRITAADKSAIQRGHAVWVKDNCLPLTDGVACGNCARHCPTGAIQMVPHDADNPDSPKIPVVNTERCIGCGACENLCPARPFSAIYVEGHEHHRII